MTASDSASGWDLLPEHDTDAPDAPDGREALDGREAAGPRAQSTAEPPRIRRNDYSPLRPPPLGEWTPALSVSVVIPAHGHPEKLALVLASLAGQSYPAELMEVVVVDDGSPEPLVLPEIRPKDTRLITSAPGGWGSGHAVNTAVAASSGEVVLRLDADMLVYREHVESQMRWHHLADYLVVMGHKLFVDFDPAAMSPEHVFTEVSEGRADTLFDRGSADPHWVESFVKRRDLLRTAHHEAYKVFVGATGSLHRTLFDEAGGMDQDLILGGDSEFGYRVSQRGAVFVPDLDTSSWHLGRSQMQTQRDAGTRFRSPFVSNRVPDFHLRRRRPDRYWDVPLADVVLDVDGRTLEEVDATASALLGGTSRGIRLWLRGPWSRLTDGRRSLLEDEHLDLRLTEEVFRGDPRVRFTESETDNDPRVPFRIHLPVGPVPVDTAVNDLVDTADKHGAGLLCAPMPGATRADEGTLRLERTAAYSRARRLSPEVSGEELDRVVEEVYGLHWTSSQDLFADGEDGPERPQSLTRLRRELAQARDRGDRMRRRAERAERKLRWFTPNLFRRVLRRLVR